MISHVSDIEKNCLSVFRKSAILAAVVVKSSIPALYRVRAEIV
ncbi:MAG: hypothetical protein P8I62_05805 [Pseudomonadales bacterium]|nr:hypothetical protein [Pseudomonadales bacterium]